MKRNRNNFATIYWNLSVHLILKNKDVLRHVYFCASLQLGLVICSYSNEYLETHLTASITYCLLNASVQSVIYRPTLNFPLKL